MYVPLRVHGFHSLLTGVDAPRDLLKRAGELGLPAIAFCDVDGVSGVVDIVKASRELGGPRVVLGAEISDPRPDRPGRLVALVENEVGYRNLCKFVSARQLGRDPGEFGAELGEPEDFDRIGCAQQYSEGLIYLVDHPDLLLEIASRVPRERVFCAISPASLAKSPQRVEREAKTRNVHLEPRRRPIPNRPDFDPDEEASELEAPKTPPPAVAQPAGELLEAARTMGVATLAVPDVYYAYASGASDHAGRIAIKHNALITDLPENWLAEKPAHLLSAREIELLYDGLPEVSGPFEASDCVQRTLDVAARCQFLPELGNTYLPEIELPPEQTAYSRLCELAFEGARKRYQPLKPEILRRLDYELTTIERLGFAPYFLLVRQLADFAKAEGIPSVGRGSAADSLVAYCLELTDADPLHYNLCFERFLNPTRSDRPDIDLDFCWRRRDEVLDHVYELFGAERTAMICTLNCFGLRAAFRESALVEGIPPAEVNRWSRRLPWSLPGMTQTSGEVPDDEQPETPAAPVASSQPETVILEHDSNRLRETSWNAPVDPRLVNTRLANNAVARAFCATPEARDFPFEDARWQRVLFAAERLVDTPRHFGLHPGGVVVSPGPITDFTACQRASKGCVVTQYDKDAVEAIGLVKMDLLGNRALTVVDDCLRSLREHDIEVDLTTLREDDPHTAETLRQGLTLGCFQIESPGVRNLLQQTRSETMDDVIQAVALIRPGPAGSGMKDAYIRRRRELEPPTPPHPRLRDVLWDTQGVMLYQEDVMQAASAVAGMDLAQADLLRRTLQKRRLDELQQRCTDFIDSCVANGVKREDAVHVWELIANFASFAFCKAHAVTYGRISYRAAWLKTHYPALFLTSFLRSETGYYAARVYVEEARRLGVPILGPDINKSAESYSFEVPNGLEKGGALRIGLGKIKGITQRTLETIFAEREARGAFLSLPDFLDRTRARTDETESLIQCGAFDGFDRTRPELSWRLHLLRTKPTRAPRTPGAPQLDPGQLAAAQQTPETRAQEAMRAAQARTGGWSRTGLGVTGADLAPGEEGSLFPEPEAPALVLPGLPDTDRQTRGQLEWELLGLTINAHPVEIFPCPADERIATYYSSGPGRKPRLNLIPCREIARFVRGRITLRGWPAASRRVYTQDGRWMRFLTLEDETGLAEVVLFPDVYERDGHHLAGFGTVCVTGVVENHCGACTLHAEKIW